MKLNRKELIESLKTVLPGVFKGESPLAGTDCFLFAKDSVKAASGHLSVHRPLETGLEGAVKAAELVQVLERMDSEEVELSQGEKSIIVKSGKTKLSMKLVEATGLQPVDVGKLDDLEWPDLPKDFSKALEMVLPSVGKKLSFGALTGVRFEGKNAMACDNFRAGWFRMDSEMPDFTLPGASGIDLLKIPELEAFAISDGWVHFLNSSGTVFSSSLIGSKYPSKALRKFFPDKWDGDWLPLPKNLKPAVERASVMATVQDDGSASYLTLKGVGSKIVVSGEREFGSILEEVDGIWPNGLEFSIRPEYLAAIMVATDKFLDLGRSVAFKAGKFAHVVCKIVSK